MFRSFTFYFLGLDISDFHCPRFNVYAAFSKLFRNTSVRTFYFPKYYIPPNYFPDNYGLPFEIRHLEVMLFFFSFFVLEKDT